MRIEPILAWTSYDEGREPRLAYNLRVVVLLSLRGLTNHNGSLFGMVDEDVRWTPKGRPHAWPPQFRERPPAYPQALVPCGHGLLVLTAKTRLRLLPPLTLTAHDVEMALTILNEVLSEMAQKSPEEQA